MTEKLFLYCRQGFEKECAAEIQDQTAKLGITGFCRTKADSGYVSFETHNSITADVFFDAVSLNNLIFTRQWFFVNAIKNDLPTENRVQPIIELLQQKDEKYSSCLFETPDTNDAKSLTPLCRKIEPPFVAQLKKAHLYSKDSPWHLHVCFLSTCAAYIGKSHRNNNSSWPGGIPRLRFPSAAPSRSTLKLEEAFLYFLTEKQRSELLNGNRTAVDLGAAPGGWTWQLVNKNVRVIAIDNGAMDEAIMDSGLVTHIRTDGFRYVPQESVDWMVCDIVEQPIRIAQLVARWIQKGWCNHTIFNLKLPMKKRYEEVQRCFELIHHELKQHSINYRLSAKQLYHDREEITVFVAKN